MIIKSKQTFQITLAKNSITITHTFLVFFPKYKGTTIEKFYLAHKIERVKELLAYDDLNLADIAYKLHYSSVAHLSNQFKKMTGLTPSQFKNLKNNKRSALGIWKSRTS